MEKNQKVTAADIKNIVYGDEETGYFDYQAEKADFKVLTVLGNVILYTGAENEIYQGTFTYSEGTAWIKTGDDEMLSDGR